MSHRDFNAFQFIAYEANYGIQRKMTERAGEKWKAADISRRMSAVDTMAPEKSVFRPNRAWNHRPAPEIESDYLQSLSLSKAQRDANLIDLVDFLVGLPKKLLLLVEEMKKFEEHLRSRGEYYVRWEAWNGKPHSAAYLMTLEHVGGTTRKKSLGNLIGGELAREQLKKAAGRNQALGYLRHLDAYWSIHLAIQAEARQAGKPLVFKPDRTLHAIEQWVKSVGTFWEELPSITQQNIDQFLELDHEVNEVAFAFNLERQPIRWRSIVCRPSVNKSDPMGPGLPGFRVVTSQQRSLQGNVPKRQTVSVSDYKRRLAKRALEKELAKALGRPVTQTEVDQARGQMREREFTPWITKELISHCRLGRHTSAINRRQKALKRLSVDWIRLRERLAALIEKRGTI